MAAIESRESFLETFQRNKTRQLNELRKENQFCDLTLKSEDGVEIRVHKVIVSSASNYFKDLLTTPMREKYQECIQLPHITGEVLEKIILFIYTGECDEKVKNVEAIIKHAVAFQLEELVGICSLVLKNYINDQTCLNYWRYFGDNLILGLQDKCLAYIAGRADYLFSNSFLKDLTIEEMRCLLAEDSLHFHFHEEKIFEYVWKWAAGKVSDTQKLSEVFSEVVDLLRFSHLRDEFICSKIFSNDDFIDNGELLKKVAKLTNSRRKLQEGQYEISNPFVNFENVSRKLLGLDSKKLFINLGEENIIQKEKPFPHNFGYTTFANNFLLVCGGEGSRSCEYLEPIGQEWRTFPSMTEVKSFHSCSYLDNKIYACGGEVSNSVEIFVLGREEWYKGPEMLSRICNFGLTTSNGVLYAIGGTGGNVETLDPRLPNWSFVGKFNSSTRSRRTRCVSIGPCIYCFTDRKRLIFDTRMNKFSNEIEFNDFKYRFNLCKLDSYIYGFGYSMCSKKYVLKLVQYHLHGTQGYTKTIGTYDCIWETALVAAYY